MEQVIKRLNDENDIIEQRSFWCREHNLNHEATVLQTKYEYGRSIIRKIQYAYDELTLTKNQK